jgi:hypothetical protein
LNTEKKFVDRKGQLHIKDSSLPKESRTVRDNMEIKES